MILGQGGFFNPLPSPRQAQTIATNNFERGQQANTHFCEDSL